MERNSKIVVLLTAVLSLTACEVEREMLKASNGSDEPAKETFFGKKIIKQGTPEYELLVKNAIALDFEENTPSPSEKAPEKASRSASGEKTFEVPADMLHSWGIRTENLQKLTVKDGCPGFESFYRALRTALLHGPDVLAPKEYLINDHYRFITRTGSTVKYGKEWWSTPLNDDDSVYENYVYKNTIKHLWTQVPYSQDFLKNAYDTPKGEYIHSHPAYGYYMQDNLNGGDFKYEFLTRAYHDGYYYNFGVWKDTSLLYGLYDTEDADLKWDFMYHSDARFGKEFVKRAASREPYKSWHPGLKSRIQGRYMDGEKEITYSRITGDLVEIKSDILENHGELNQVLSTEFNEQEEETITNSNSTENKWSGGVSTTYEGSASLFGLVTAKSSLTLKFEYNRTNSNTHTIANRKLKWYKTGATITVPPKKRYLVKLYSYKAQVDFSQPVFLKVFQKLFNNKDNFQVPPFISLNQSTWEPLINVSLRVFASKSGLANGYKNRYLYTGIDYSEEPQNNINAYDLLYMGGSQITFRSTGNMRKLVKVFDITSSNHTLDVTDKVAVRDLRYN